VSDGSANLDEDIFTEAFDPLLLSP